MCAWGVGAREGEGGREEEGGGGEGEGKDEGEGEERRRAAALPHSVRPFSRTRVCAVCARCASERASVRGVCARCLRVRARARLSARTERRESRRHSNPLLCGQP